MNEAAKIKDRLAPYLTGFIIDIASGGYGVTPDAFTIDGRALEGVKFVSDDPYTLHEQLAGKIPLADVVFSSHFLEHIGNQWEAINCWTRLLKKGGLLINVLPDANFYDNKANPEHMVNMEYEDFMFWFERVWCGTGKDFRGNNFAPVYELIDHGLDVGVDRYSFWVVAKKL